MKHQSLFLAILCLFVGCQPQEYTSGNVGFIKYYGGAYDNFLADAIALQDNQFALLGTTQSFVEGIVDSTRIKPYQVLLLQTDQKGNEVWRKNIGSNNRSEVGKSFKRTQNGGYIIVSTILPANTTIPKFDAPILSESRSFSLIGVTCTDNNGNILWRQILGDSAKVAYQACDVMQAQNGDFIVLANMDSLSNDIFAQDMYIARINSAGNIIWQKKYGTDGFRHDFGVKLYEVPTSAGEMIWLGSIQNNATDNINYDIRLVKADNLGNPIWERTYNQPFRRDYPTAIIPSAQGYVVLCFSEQDNTILSQIIEVDRQGEFITRRNINFTTSTMIGQGRVSTQNTIIVSGINFQGNVGSVLTGFTIATLDFDGNIKFHETYGGNLNIADVTAQPSVTLALPDGAIAFGGTIRFGQNKMLALFKTDTQGKINH